MSSSETRRPNHALLRRDVQRRNVLRLIGLGTVAALAGACQVRPLYAPGPAGTVREPLDEIAIEAPASRIEQVITNELTRAMSGAAVPAYRLTMTVRSTTSTVGVAAITANANARSVTVSTSFQLLDAATNAPVFTGTSSAIAAFETGLQRFTNERAERDAEDRAARVIAEDISTRIAAILTAA